MTLLVAWRARPAAFSILPSLPSSFVDHVADHVFSRAFSALAKCGDFFAERVVVLATSFQGNLFSE